MPTQPLNSTLKPTSEAESGLSDRQPLELDPWEIAHLLICKREEQPIELEFATDDEFDQWVQTNSISVKDNGITGWSFDDRCRLVNFVLARGGVLEFADGTRIPEDIEERIPTQELLESGECLE